MYLNLTNKEKHITMARMNKHICTRKHINTINGAWGTFDYIVRVRGVDN